MNAQHTLGPWSVNDWPQATTDIAIGAVGTPLIAKVPLRDVSINEQKANARLIAECPELLTQLETMVRAFLVYAPKIEGAEYNCVLNARALIAKIKGGAA